MHVKLIEIIFMPLLMQVLLKCMSIAHLYQGNATVLSEAVHLATRLVAIPTQVKPGCVEVVTITL